MFRLCFEKYVLYYYFGYVSNNELLQRQTTLETIFTWKEHWESLIRRVSLFTEVDVQRCCNFCNFIKKRLQHRCFPINIAKFLRTPILKNICECLLLHLVMNDIIPFFMNNNFLQNLEPQFQVFMAAIFNEIWVSLLL